LLPEAIEDYVVTGNPVLTVDGLDLAAAGFKRVKPKMAGRPGYARAICSNSPSTAISTACGQAGGLRPNALVTSRSFDFIWEWMSGMGLRRRSIVGRKSQV
jgi:hypothetical protein